MQRLRKYQEFAARCLQEARSTTDPHLKALLGEWAQEWQKLVERGREARANTHPIDDMMETQAIKARFASRSGEWQCFGPLTHQAAPGKACDFISH
jgi:hypothetical protein